MLLVGSKLVASHFGIKIVMDTHRSIYIYKQMTFCICFWKLFTVNYAT